MTWFKVDDGLHASTKARRAGESMALWVMAGSWCADQLTDGWLPEDMAEVLAPKYWRRWAAKLVQVGLWVVEDHGAERGWRFHDWDVYQPSREQVLAERKAAADRQQRARDRARESRRNGVAASRVSHAVTDAVTTPVSHGPPDPTRPDQRTTTGSYVGPGRLAHTPPREAPPSDAEPSRVELLIAEYRDNSPRPVPSRQAEKLAAEIHTLIGDGFTDVEIRNGLGQLRVRKLGPGMLPAIVDELANTLPGNVVALRPSTRPSTTDQRVADAVERGRRLQALHDRGELGS